jgi:DMSO reductase family type II enzyme chaperone
MNLTDRLSVERARGECYRLLAACFYIPEQELWLSENLLESVCALLPQVSPATAEHCHSMMEGLSQSSGEDLAVEYARLFVGPQRVLAAPYGSVYLDEGRRVMGDSTLEVLEIYREAGLSLDPDFKELPDHIAAELEFMHYLTVKAVEAAAAGQGRTADEALHMRDEFLHTFLNRWVPGFCASIRAGTQNRFYRGLANCLSTFIAEPVSPLEVSGTAGAA